MTLYQTGSTVTGYWLATGGTYPVSGSLTGTVSSNTLSANLIVPTGASSTYPGPGTFLGNLTLSNNSLSGSVSGTSTTSGAFTASMNLTQSR